MATFRGEVLTLTMCSVRLGNSGLKVSRIILGIMQYGNKGWQEWVLGEDQAVEHIKTA
jgi:aryl-alcohol dehydrogenase-like predicted oxidoreductase